MAIDINLPRVFSENVEVMETSYQIILRSGQGLTSSNKENSANFSGEKKYNEAFRGVYFWTIREKT